MALTAIPSTQPGATPPYSKWLLSGHEDEVLSVSTCGNIGASSSVDGTILLWLCTAGRTPENVCKLSTGGPAVLDTAFLQTNRLVSAQGNGGVVLWDIETGASLHHYSRAPAQRNTWPVINAVAASANESVVYYGGDDGYLMRCDTRTNSCAVFRRITAPITAVACCRGEDYVFAGDATGELYWYDSLSKAGTVAALPPLPRDGAISSLTHDSKTKTLLAACSAGSVVTMSTKPFAASPDDRMGGILSTGERPSSRPLFRCGWNNGLMAFPAGPEVLCMKATDFPSGRSRSLAGVGGSNCFNAVSVLSSSQILACRGSELILFDGV